MNFNYCALGGTFDHLHLGHQKFISTAINNSNHLTIGITSDKLVATLKDSKNILPLSERKKELENFLKTKTTSSHYKIITLNNTFGPTIKDLCYQAIFVTKKTKPTAIKINRIRIKTNLPKLKIITTPFVLDQSKKIISSQKIREGYINRQGLVYKKQFNKKIVITKTQRQLLKKPLAKIIKIPKQENKQNLIILVGDQALYNFKTHHLPFDIGIFDLHIKRKKHHLFSNNFIDSAKYKVINPKGEISTTLSNSIYKTIKAKKGLIFVKGEEDLSALPATLFSPLGSAIYYGQPDKGLVKLIATEKTKQNILNILSL